MKALLKKEFRLCLHPTALIFLAFAGFVFIPSYPYEVMFFFSGLSVFFICLTARENGDASFSCVLPVKKGDVARARIFMCVILQVALLALAACTTSVKQLCFSSQAQVNQAGFMANTAFLGGGAFILGLFDLIFFPLYWGAPEKVGVPFLLASIAEFILIAVFLICRHTVPFVRDVLNTPDPNAMSIKLAVFGAGLFFYVLAVWGAVRLSVKRFCRIDL